MVWTVLSGKLKTPVVFVPGRMSSQRNCEALEHALLAFSNEVHGETGFFQKDNPPAHTLNYMLLFDAGVEFFY